MLVKRIISGAALNLKLHTIILLQTTINFNYIIIIVCPIVNHGQRTGQKSYFTFQTTPPTNQPMPNLRPSMPQTRESCTASLGVYVSVGGEVADLTFYVCSVKFNASFQGPMNFLSDLFFTPPKSIVKNKKTKLKEKFDLHL